MESEVEPLKRNTKMSLLLNGPVNLTVSLFKMCFGPLWLLPVAPAWSKGRSCSIYRPAGVYDNSCMITHYSTEKRRRNKEKNRSNSLSSGTWSRLNEGRCSHPHHEDGIRRHLTCISALRRRRLSAGTDRSLSSTRAISVWSILHRSGIMSMCRTRQRFWTGGAQP